MARTKRYCNYKHKTTLYYYHKYKFQRSYCRCDYCVDDHASKHRREKNKIELKREWLNHLSISEDVLSACVYICEPWKWCATEDGLCSFANEVEIFSYKRQYCVK